MEYAGYYFYSHCILVKYPLAFSAEKTNPIPNIDL